MNDSKIANFTDKLGDWNPQLLREIKERLKPLNIAIGVIASLVLQYLMYNIFISDYTLSAFQKHQDWFQLFTTFNTFNFFICLVGGMYVISQDLATEEKTGTLNFIRLSPYSPIKIFLGKILGVPIPLYCFVACGIPLQVVAGLSAGIPLFFLILFYLHFIACTGVFFSFTIFYTLENLKKPSFNALWTGGLGFFILVQMSYVLYIPQFGSQTPFDWLILQGLSIYPATSHLYLLQTTGLTIPSMWVDSSAIFSNLLWYGQPLWKNPLFGMIFITVNSLFITSGFLKLGQLRFNHPIIGGRSTSKTISDLQTLSKRQSYWNSLIYTLILIGFTVSPPEYMKLSHNLGIFQLFFFIHFFRLNIQLTPSFDRQKQWLTSHQINHFSLSTLAKELLFNDKSPAILALFLNLLIAFFGMVFTIVFLNHNENVLLILLGIILGGTTALVYAFLRQWIVFSNNYKRFTIPKLLCGLLIILTFLGYNSIFSQVLSQTGLWVNNFLSLITPTPILIIQQVNLSSIFLTLLTEIVFIAGISYPVMRQLKQYQTPKILKTPISEN